MSLRIGDKVVIMAKTYNRSQLDLKEGRDGKVLDLKWNLIFIEFENGECDWIEGRHVRLKTEK
jgi:hypothetical protein